jgi:hypothetical protein
MRNMNITGDITRWSGVLLVVGILAMGVAFADDGDNGNNGCAGLPGFAALQSALNKATKDETSGLNNQMWATIVDRDGIVCAIAFSGINRGAQWPGSRVISAQKANTANAFSLDSSSFSDGSGQAAGLALSTANLLLRCSLEAASSACSSATPSILLSPTPGRPHATEPPMIPWSDKSQEA